MSRARVNQICATFPGAEVSEPWGEGLDAWKVAGKMFAASGGIHGGLSVKTDSIETAQMLIDAGVGERARYFHRSWIHLPDGTDDGEIEHRLRMSYALVRAGLTRKVQAMLPPFTAPD